MSFWKSRQERIGVFTKDQRRVENAIVCLDNLEELLKRLLKAPYKLDEYAIAKLIAVHAEAARAQAVAASGEATILSALQNLAYQEEKYLRAALSRPDSPKTTIQILMCKAMLESINRQVTAWQKGPRS